MEELIIKLAKLYPTEDRARLILTFANIKTSNIAFNPAADVNWMNILNVLSLQPVLLIRLFEKVISKYPNEEVFFRQRIEEELNKNHVPGENPVSLQDVVQKVDLFDALSIVGDQHSFINRQNVKKQFRQLIDPSSRKNTMLIQGREGSGLTHIHLYIADMIFEMRNHFKLVQVGPEFRISGKKNHYITGVSVAKVINDRLSLGWTPSELNKETESKYATFFNRLNEYSEKQNKAPIICLDGFYKMPTPDINEFVVQLLQEATTFRTFYVIISLRSDNIMKNDWPHHLKDMPAVKIDSFMPKDVRNYVKQVYSGYYDEFELQDDPEEFSNNWVQKRAHKLPFDGPGLNVKIIGQECTKWYRKFTTMFNE